MCGFAGYIGSGNLKSKIGDMAKAIVHRGPDDRDFFMDEDKGLALGFQRLSIQDLSKAGAQPMRSRSGRYVLVYNGEIYNFKELRAELESKKHSFKGDSDTEVLLAAIEEWGLETTLIRLSGMFALALYDTHYNAVFLARDRMGQKPLYYGAGSDGLYFASELKSIVAGLPAKPVIDRDVAALYLRWRYVPDPHCIYEGFHKLLPGSIVRLSLDDQSITPPQTYWSLQNVITDTPPFEGDEEAALDKLDELLKRAVKSRMIADVPLGSFLSGGVDSALVSALMRSVQNGAGKPIKTFTIGFEDEAYNEASHARAVAEHLGTNHTEMTLSEGDALETVSLLPEIFDEPFGDASAIPTYHVCRMARDYMTVALTGDGGDESFGGYASYARARTVLDYPNFVRAFVAAFLKFSPQQRKMASILKARGPRAMYMRLYSYWQTVRAPLLTYAPKPLGAPFDDIEFKGDMIAQLMAYDSVMFLPGDVLAKLDRTSMAVSLEARSPLLDHEVIEFAWSLPLEMRTDKALLRKLLYRYVPQEMVDRPKQGFSVPHSQWLRGPLSRWAEDLLIEDYTGLLNMRSVQKIWQAHRSGKADYGHLLWTIVQFQAWAKKWT